MGELQAYSVKRTAELIGCSPRHVYNLIEAGELQCFLLGKTGRRIRAAEIERWQNTKILEPTKDISSDDEVTSTSQTMLDRMVAESAQR